MSISSLKVPRRTIATAAVTASIAALCTVSASPAGAATPDPVRYSAAAGATAVHALSGTVTSNRTANVTISGVSFPASRSNSIADASNPLISTGAGTTSVSADQTASGSTISANATVANVNLLGGAITADAMNTSTAARDVNGVFSYSGNATFTNLQIGGNAIPTNAPRNFTVTIPGLASVVVNRLVGRVSGAGVVVSADALRVTLLAPYSGSPAGTMISVDPERISLQPMIPGTVPSLDGYAFGTYADGVVPGPTSVDVGRTGAVYMPQPGTGGKWVHNSTAAVQVPGVVSAAEVKGRERGVRTTDFGDATTGFVISNLNVLGGLITASAVKGHAHILRYWASGTTTTGELTHFVGLTIDGHAYAATVHPNTVITVPGIAQITLNGHDSGPEFSYDRAIHVTLLSALAGLPAGAQIDVGVARAGTTG